MRSYISALLALTFGFCLLLVPLSASAKIPSEVITPYKAYKAALEEGNQKAAKKHAYQAWQKAEELLGDSKTTGDLAQNYGDLGRADYDKKFVTAFERSKALSNFYGEDKNLIWLDRSIRLATFYKLSRKSGKMASEAKSAQEFAEANGLTKTTYYGEALTLRAENYVKKGQHKKTQEMSMAAIKAFENAEDGLISVQPLIAKLYSGFGNEGLDNSLEAALDYQAVMETIDGKLPQDHPLAAQALGRWSHMRNRLHEEGLLNEAEEKGLCKCWPYDKPRNESIKPIKRVPGTMPRKAAQSGYSIIEFDLANSGEPTNIRALVSWPEYYEEPSVKAVKKWKYTPKTADETTEERKSILTTMRYILKDTSGDVIY
jgi:hypothetical protein